ncbi:MAG: type II toxin-antitoxin system VapB family antitoxin [Chloroflexota bacterium]|nr:type II toxin-antitoxin system VapB family antitoxin [Chloroflexota bacterium]
MKSVSIKNQEAYRLIKELADLEGKSTTTVVIEAVREKLDRTRKPQINEARMQYWLDFGQRVCETTDPELLALNPDDILYDENGLPK